LKPLYRQPRRTSLTRMSLTSLGTQITKVVFHMSNEVHVGTAYYK
jgi:hypothetical protein